jgi:hypothetical protein
MEKKMKKTLNAALLVALFATISIAEDGNQGSGGRNCDPNVDPTCHPAANPGGCTGEDEIGIGEIVIRSILDAIELVP